MVTVPAAPPEPAPDTTQLEGQEEVKDDASVVSSHTADSQTAEDEGAVVASMPDTDEGSNTATPQDPVPTEAVVADDDDGDDDGCTADQFFDA